MLVLGIETSCDETGVALLRQEGGRTSILLEEVSTQAQLHEAYGGVVPELASREHLQNLPLLVDTAVKRVGVDLAEIDLFAVARGPGLLGCLLMGVAFVKGLAAGLERPWIGVNHIEAHLLAACLDNPGLSFPFLGLIVSGGHTEIVLARSLGVYEVLARTVDDAAGEAFDKSASLLKLPYPGGPRLAALADQVTSSPFNLPKVMRSAEGFSFSGLKTAIALLIREQESLLEDPGVVRQLAYAVQDSIVDALCFKLKRALKDTGLKQVAVCGGVSANRYLRRKVQMLRGIRPYFPEFKHSTDNAAMVAYAGALHFAEGQHSSWDTSARPRWPLEELAGSKGGVSEG